MAALLKLPPSGGGERQCRFVSYLNPQIMSDFGYRIFEAVADSKF